ncbi:peptide-N4-(N-acetyl-beta-glucosaminyl) asparagine amidase protein [Rutstroemia sp. NJR-2017a WRK4]|nr:peptide-N4-(N-acetyl-beta-glucosaminyl) asparagine amidase protein [Rutstroemia sp. NJR-2017a WRK4]
MPFISDSDLPLRVLVKTHINSMPTAVPLSLSNMGTNGNNGDYSQTSSTNDLSIPQALELARESEQGAENPAVIRVLENAIETIWGKLQAEPTSYVMTREEFAVFNYFQRRFEGHELAVDARRRYWDSFQGSTESG